MSTRVVVSFSGSPFTSEKLNGKNYLFWFASTEMWFLGQGYHDHLDQDGSDVPYEKAEQFKQVDTSCVPYRGSLLNQNYWEHKEPLKPVTHFGRKFRTFL